VTAIHEKLQVRARTQAVAMFFDHGRAETGRRTSPIAPPPSPGLKPQANLPG
jgi:hypothetical protein